MIEHVKQRHRRYTKAPKGTTRDKIYIIWEENHTGWNSRILDIAEEKISQLEDLEIITLQNDIQREK